MLQPRLQILIKSLSQTGQYPRPSGIELTTLVVVAKRPLSVSSVVRLGLESTLSVRIFVAIEKVDLLLMLLKPLLPSRNAPSQSQMIALAPRFNRVARRGPHVVEATLSPGLDVLFEHLQDIMIAGNPCKGHR